MPNPLLTVLRNHDWRNKHQNVTVTADSFYDVFNLWADAPAPPKNDWRPGLQGLRAVVGEAERTGKRLRGLGGAWSLSEAAITRDIMVNTKALNFVELGLRASSLDAAFSGDRAALCFTQCGTSVMELYQFLEGRGFTLPTGGASNGQTIAGAVSTGTHGAANAVGAMQDFILGMHLIVDGGRHVWIERASKPVVSEAFCHTLGAALRRDDELFDAAVVSFGSFGMIHAFLFQAEPLYLLEKSVMRVDYEVAKRTLGTLDVTPLNLSDGAALPFHYEVLLDPYNTGAGQQGAYIRYMYKRPFQAGSSSAGGGGGLTPGDDAMGFLGAITNPAPEVVPLIIGHILSAQLKPVTQVLGTPGQQFGPTDTRGFVMSTEIGVALSDAENAVDAVLEVARTFPWAGFPAVRYVKGSGATLPFTHFSPITCTIELPSAGSDRTKLAFERVWVELHRRNIVFTLHWGQCLRPSAIHFSSAYGARVARWQSARQGLLGSAGRQTFSSDWLEKLNLA
jgi:FAD/FMN-containing dehydrogenase